MYVFTFRYKLEGVAFYATKLPRKRTTLPYIQEYGVISPVNLDYKIWSKFTYSYKFFDIRSNRQKGMLELVCVSVGCPTRSSIYAFVPCLSLLCSVSCCSPIFVLSAPKHWSRSGFIRQSTIFTLVTIFRTSSFLSVTSSQMWWNRISMCFVFAW